MNTKGACLRTLGFALILVLLLAVYHFWNLNGYVFTIAGAALVGGIVAGVVDIIRQSRRQKIYVEDY